MGGGRGRGRRREGVRRERERGRREKTWVCALYSVRQHGIHWKNERRLVVF